MSFLHAVTPTRRYADTRPFVVAALPRCDLCDLPLNPLLVVLARKVECQLQRFPRDQQLVTMEGKNHDNAE